MTEKITNKQFRHLMKAVYKLNSMEACIRFKKPQLIDDFVRRSDVVNILQKMNADKKSGKYMLSLNCANCKKKNEMTTLEGGKKFTCTHCGTKNIIINWGGGFKTEAVKK